MTPTTSLTLPPELLDQLADQIASRVIERLAEQRIGPAWVDAVTLARLLGISRAAVYDHAEELGARRLGDGPRPRLRFDPEVARAAWTARLDTPPPQSPRPRSRRLRRVELLPVRGEDGQGARPRSRS